MEEMTPLPLPQKQLPEGGRHSPILLLASFFLILISLTTSAYLYIQNQRLSSQLTLVPSSTPSPSTDPTSDWQTYTNTKYNYTIKLPNDWKINSNEPGSGEIKLNTTSRGVILYPSTFSNGLDSKTYITIETDSAESGTYTTYEDWLKATEKPFFSVIKTENTMLNSINSRLIIGNYDGYGYKATLRTYSFPSLDKLTYFSITVTEPSEENLSPNIPNQILSTFKFTDPTADWRKYDNEKQGITFKYPEGWILTEERGDEDNGHIYNERITLSKNSASIIMIFDLNGIGGNGEDIKGVPYILDNINLYKYSRAYPNGRVGVGLTDTLKRTLGVFRVGNKTYSITLSYSKEDISNKYEKDFDQILSTFKFTN